MKSKKLLIMSMMLIALVCIVCLTTSCSLIDKYGYSEWETVVEPTCTTFGIQKRVSVFGTAEYAKIDALAHTVVTDAAVGATCTSTGKTEGSHCSACGTVITAQSETAITAHSFSEWETVTESTCTAFGLEKRACECGYVEYAAKSALSHNVVTDAAVAATCTTGGKTEGSHCDRCGVVIVAQTLVAATGHACDEITILEEAVCNLPGVKRISCSNTDCSYYYDESYSIPELDSSEIFANAMQYTGLLQAFDRWGNLYDEGIAIVLSADGKIITSEFIVENAFSATFTLGEVCYDVTEILAYSEKSHVAVLKIDATDLPYANICMRAPVNGETVYTVGIYEEFNYSVSRGVISNANLLVDEAIYMQHDADMSAAHIGGPLINRFGEVIGVNVGYYGAYEINASAWIAEIENLDYSNPISVAEYGSITYTPEEQLEEWVINNYNVTSSESAAYLLEGDTFYYALGYNLLYGHSYVEGYWLIQDVYELKVLIYFDNSEGTYHYCAFFTDGMSQNETCGFIDAAAFTSSTVLEYDTYYGRYWTESELMGLYSTAVYDTLEWFSYCLDTYFVDLTLETFGFTSLSYDRDEEALDKLNSFVMTYGTYDSLLESYALSGASQMGDDVMSFNITYTPSTGDTNVSVHYALANGSTYSAYLTLNPGEDGNFFAFMHSAYGENGFEILNSAWGYLDAATLTPMSQLTCYVFDGMNEYEDALLRDYVSLLNYMMDLINNYVMPSVDPALSVKDLGYLFYFG